MPSWGILATGGGIGVIVVALVTKVVLRARRQRQAWNRAMVVHRRRITRAYGCMACGTELFPGQWLWVCTVCSDVTTMCEWCHDNPRSRNPIPDDNRPHLWVREPIPWERDFPLAQVRSVASALEASFATWYDRRCLGTRPHFADGTFSPCYEWLTYGEVRDRVLCAAAALRRLDVHPGDVVVLFGAASVEWFVAQYSCWHQGVVVAIVHHSSTLGAVRHLLQQASPRVIITSTHLAPLVQCALGPQAELLEEPPSHIITYDDPPHAYTLRDPCPEAPPADATSVVEVVPWQGCLDVPLAPGYQPAAVHVTDDDLCSLIPTSGTSGLPKLVMMTNSMLRCQVSVPRSGRPLVLHVIQPLRQSLDVLAKGGQMGIWSGSYARLTPDLVCLRPTAVGSTPVFWQALYNEFQADVQDHMRTIHCSHAEAHDAVKAHWKERNLLGNRCRTAIIGGAKSSPDLRRWIFDVLGCSVVDGYGCTETGGLASNSIVSNPSNLQLVDCPELGYTTSDEPFPRGEIWASTARCSPGYYGNPVATEEAFVMRNGRRWFRTGDIGELRPGGGITVIDRRSSLFKCAQGVFVAPSPIEQVILSTCSSVDQAWVFGRSTWPAVMCVVVEANDLEESQGTVGAGTEDHGQGDACAGKGKADGGAVNGANSACTRPASHELTRAVQACVAAAGHPVWEVPFRVFVAQDTWTEWNGCRSSIGKPNRNGLRRRFEALISSIDGQVGKESTGITAAVVPCDDSAKDDREGSGIGDVLSSGLLRLLRSTLPSHVLSMPLRRGTEWSTLGADSLTLSRLSGFILERHGVDLSVPTLLKMPTLGALEEAIYSGGTVVPTAAPLAGGHVPWLEEVTRGVKACDVELQAATTGDEPVATCAHMLVTGATGFVGSFVVHTLLALHAFPASNGANIACLVRAESDDAALARLRHTLTALDLWDGVVADAVAGGHLTAIAGDLSLARWGLADRVWCAYARPSSALTHIVHVGAAVHSMSTYHQLRAANVDATATAMALAAASGACMHHISTIGMLSGSGIVQEHLVPEPHAGLDNLSGYAQSKWVAEQVVSQCTETYKVSAAIYRLGTMFSSKGHPRGSANVRDTVVRLVCGMVCDGVTCMEPDSPLPPSFTLVPIDCAATALVRLMPILLQSSNESPCAPPVYHIVNPIPTPLSILVRGATLAGYPIAELTTAQFRDHMRDLRDPSHPWYAFASVLRGRGYARSATDQTSVALVPQDHHTRRALQDPTWCIAPAPEDVVHMLAFCCRMDVIPSPPPAAAAEPL